MLQNTQIVLFHGQDLLAQAMLKHPIWSPSKNNSIIFTDTFP